ncbi:MAG: ParB/RepB/Spo0J family partition protein, partial [Blautia wexlerae]
MGRFSVRDMLGKQSIPERREEQTIVYRDPRELVPTKENFYNTRNIDKLKASIKITGYLMQPILIENIDGKDQVLAGHRRRLCCIELVNEGDTRFEKVPCMYAAEIKISEDEDLSPEQKEAITPFMRQFKVIQANNYRDKNDWERMQEALEMEKIVKNLKEKVGITGTVRENLKDLLGVSNAQFGRYKNISNHLIQELMEEFQDGGINISVADAAASLKPELQQQAYEMFMKNKVLSLPDVQLLKDRQELDIPGQMTIEQATRQQKPQEDETPIPVELQIERFFDSLKKNTTARIRNGDKLMGTKMISMLYCYVKHRNGYLNYQGHPDRITFNPDSPEEKEMTWQELTEELIRRYSTKKPVKMTTIDAPEKPEKKETNVGKCIHREGFTCTLEETQKTMAGDGENCNRKCCWSCEKHGTCGYECNASAHRPAGNIPEKSCQSAAETPDKKQQEDHSGDSTEMAKHL